MQIRPTLDPRMFVAINENVADLLGGRSNSRYSPLEVVQWLEICSADADRNLAEAKTRTRDATAPEYRRVVLDVQIQSGLGKFFAWKIRSASLYAIYQQTGDRAVLEQAVSAYLKARNAWSGLADQPRTRT